MPTYNSNILPATTGLALGNQNFQWTAYLSNVFTASIASLSINPALTGFLRLASTDVISWRNAVNTLDLKLSKTTATITTTPADTLVFSGSGIEGPFISSSPSPAAAGQVRLANADAINFRNAAASADIAGLVHNADDTVTVGGVAGITQSVIQSFIPNPASLGIVRLANGDSVNWRNAANTADEGLSNSPTAGGLVINSANPNLSLGGSTAGFPMIKRVAQSIALRLADDSAYATLLVNTLTAQNLTTLTSYNGIALVGNGVPSETSTVDLTGQGAAIGTTTFGTAFASGPLRISWYAKVTTVDATSSTLGPLTVTYADETSISRTMTCGAQTTAGAIATTSTANTTAGGILVGLPMMIVAAGSTSLQYTFGYASNVAGTMKFSLHIRVEAM